MHIWPEMENIFKEIDQLLEIDQWVQESTI